MTNSSEPTMMRDLFVAAASAGNASSGSLQLFTELDCRDSVSCTPFVEESSFPGAGPRLARDTLYFDQLCLAERFAAAVKGAGYEAVISLDENAYEFDDSHQFRVAYNAPEVTEFSASPYSAVGRMASRFKD